MKHTFDVITAAEHDRLEALYEPFAQAMRELVDAGVRTEVDPQTIAEATAAVEAVTASLRREQRDGPHAVLHAETNRPVVWANPVVGLRNALAPPLVIEHAEDGSCWSEFVLGAAYEGPLGWVHGGICALVLDHILGEVASGGLTRAALHRDHHVPISPGHAAGAAARRGLHRPDRGRENLCAGPYQRRRRNHRRGRRRLHHAGVGAGCRMKFYVSMAFMDTREAVEVARAADDLGYDGMGIPDHVVNLETLKTPYPYTKDGKRRWEAFTDWPDPWVMIGALALVTTRLKFVTTVYLPAMRDPYSAAKAIGTAAYLAGGRLELGIGVGWCEEEFELLGQQFARRGKRTDEMLESDEAAVGARLDRVLRRVLLHATPRDGAHAAADPDLRRRTVRYRAAPGGAARRLDRRSDLHRGRLAAGRPAT